MHLTPPFFRGLGCRLRWPHGIPSHWARTLHFLAPLVPLPRVRGVLALGAALLKGLGVQIAMTSRHSITLGPVTSLSGAPVASAEGERCPCTLRRPFLRDLGCRLRWPHGLPSHWARSLHFLAAPGASAGGERCPCTCRLPSVREAASCGAYVAVVHVLACGSLCAVGGAWR